MNVKLRYFPAEVETVTLTLRPEELLALAAVLDHADPEFLREDGVEEDVISVTEEIYETVENATSAIYGEDWDLLTNVDDGGAQSDDGLTEEDLDMIFPLDAYAAGRF
jgi:hypothetical protein